MARYIDAEEITRRIVYYYGHTNEGCGEHYAYGVALKEIDRTPTADVVEVVRCKDCIFYEPHGNGKVGICRHLKLKSYLKHNIDFCSYGERRDT